MRNITDGDAQPRGWSRGSLRSRRDQPGSELQGLYRSIELDHAAFLRPVISRAESDPVLLAGGAAEPRRLLGRVAAASAVITSADAEDRRSRLP